MWGSHPQVWTLPQIKISFKRIIVASLEFRLIGTLKIKRVPISMICS